MLHTHDLLWPNDLATLPFDLADFLTMLVPLAEDPVFSPFLVSSFLPNLPGFIPQSPATVPFVLLVPLLLPLLLAGKLAPNA